MNVSISSFSLGNWYRKDPIVPGMKVCPSNGVSSVGTITEIGPPSATNGLYGNGIPQSITVLWGTGNKRGKITTVEPDRLADLNAYIACCEEYIYGFNKLIAEANTLGM